jgi:hypothetical protein
MVPLGNSWARSSSQALGQTHQQRAGKDERHPDEAPGRDFANREVEQPQSINNHRADELPSDHEARRRRGAEPGRDQNVDADKDRADRPAQQQQVERRARDIGNRGKLTKSHRVDANKEKPARAEGNDSRRDRPGDASCELRVRRHLDWRQRPNSQGDQSQG